VQIEIVPCLSDNYAYLIKHGEDCAILDPSEAAPVKAALEKLSWQPQFILNTHHHNDHVGGNLALKETYGAKVVGPGKDKARIPGIDIGVDEQSGWSFAGRPVQVLEVPGHTRSAITFVMGDNAFTGDTLFAMGCGRLFEGDLHHGAGETDQSVPAPAISRDQENLGNGEGKRHRSLRRDPAAEG
jgi:hydroxyacylglutathione hydrolase